MRQIVVIGRAILGRSTGFFSLDQLMRDTRISRKYCRDVLTVFCQEGIVKQIRKRRKEHVPGRPPIYAMIYRVIDRKRLAGRISPRRKEGTIQDRMWYVARNKFRGGSSFNLRDLMFLAGVQKGMARWYLKALRRTGYIQPSRSGGGPGVEWKLTRDWGPERPFLDHSRPKGKGIKKSAPLAVEKTSEIG
jgi:hypothetical protein